MKQLSSLLVLLLAALVCAACAGKTTPASDVTTSTATLRATGSCDGTGTPCHFWFRYRVVGQPSTATATTLRGPVATRVTNAALSEPISRLRPGTAYEYQLCGWGDQVPRDKALCVGGDGTTSTWQAFRTKAVDTTPPTGFIGAPAAGSMVSGNEVPFVTGASDNAPGELRVVHYVDGVAIGQATKTGLGYVSWWNSLPVATGSHRAQTRITDAAGNVTTTKPVYFNVANPVPSPSIAAPRCGTTQSGKFMISAAANDAVSVEIFVDKLSLGRATPTVFGWVREFDSTRLAFGTHYITARASNGAGSAVSAQCRITTEAARYTNPVYASDAPDPTVMRGADGVYYAYTTGTGFPILRSTDLEHWESAGRAFPAGRPAWVSNSWWAPDVSRTGNHYTMLYSGRGTDGKMRIGYATSPNPWGPFADRGILLSHGGSWGYVIDPNLVQVAPGRYVVYYGSTGGTDPKDQTGISVVGVSIGTDGSMKAQLPGGVVLPERGDRILVEGAWMVHRGAYWYLFYSDGEWSAASGSNEYQLKVARATSPSGPFTKRGAPVVRGAGGFGGTGHGSTVTDDEGSTWLLYHAWTGNRSRGRVLMLDRIDWSSGWPVVNNNRGSSSTAQPAPIIH